MNWHESTFKVPRGGRTKGYHNGGPTAKRESADFLAGCGGAAARLRFARSRTHSLPPPVCSFAIALPDPVALLPRARASIISFSVNNRPSLKTSLS